MQYRVFGKTGKMVSAVGMGANRFGPGDVATPAGIERCAALVVRAAGLGVNVFDNAASYSAGKCEEILRLALPQIRGQAYVCGKSISAQEKTSDAVLRHIERSLENIGIPRFDFYYMWCVKSLAQFDAIMMPGGPYAGALKAKERGLISHICFSSHASPQDTVRIIHSGAFEGVLLSYSLVNFRENNVVLQAAGRQDLGVAVMNPLGGGVIPSNGGLFGGAVMETDGSVVEAALKFIYAHPQVGTVLCGMGTEDELREDVRALSAPDENAAARPSFVAQRLTAFPDFCTGCNYCAGCPAGLPIATIMTAYNQTKFKSGTFLYHRSDPEIIKRGNFFSALENRVVFEDAANPCLHCGKCEEACTQHLPITGAMEEVYRWCDENCACTAAQNARLQHLIGPGVRRVGFFTGGAYTSYIIARVHALFADMALEQFVFDNNPLRWGQPFQDGLVIKDPAEIPQLGLDVLLISNYIHSDAIYDDLLARFPQVNIQKLHGDNDVPWTF